MGESSEWTSIEYSVKDNRANFCKALDGKTLSSALYGMYAVTLNELKAILKVSAQVGQSDAVNKTSVESTTQDDNFQEVRRHKRHISNNTLQTAKNSTKPVQTSAAVKMPPKAVVNLQLLCTSQDY
jgi:dsDNA-specific endonuclease/ATPase MutS2